MKRIALGIALGLGVLLAVGVALAWTQPEMVPPWARLRVAEVSGPAEVDYGLYCKEHGVPEKFCTLCHEELKTSLLLCAEHGDIPEDICTLCHPEVEEKYDIVVCEEHDLPEHFCYLCGNGPSASTGTPGDGWCAAHNVPESLCTECAGDVVTLADGTTCRAPLPEVKLASRNLAQRIGLETAAVVEERHAHHVEANAETAYDANRYAEVLPRVEGFVREVRVDLGSRVEPGDVLAVIDSAEISAAKARYLAARAAVELAEMNLKRTMGLLDRSFETPQGVLEDRTDLDRARADLLADEQRLVNLGFTPEDLERIARTRDNAGALEVRAPIGGTVVQRHAVRGEAVQPTTQLLAIADTSSMWLWIDVYESDIAAIDEGQPVRFEVSGGRNRSDLAPIEGTVTWVGTEVDERTRTTKVRAELSNADGRLRSNQFGRAAIQVEPEHDALVIPRDALQSQDGADLVFLPLEPDRYRPQRVLTRPTGDPHRVEVAWGLRPGQSVVTDGAFLLKTEIMRGAIGAGCCE